MGQPNLAAMVLRGVWAEHARTVSGAMARKTVVISTTRLLLVPELLASAPDTFLALLQAAMAIVLTDQSFKGEIKDDDNAPGNFDEFCGGSSGCSAAYVPLIYASSGEVDLYPSEHATVAMGNVMTLLSSSQPKCWAVCMSVCTPRVFAHGAILACMPRVMRTFLSRILYPKTLRCV